MAVVGGQLLLTPPSAAFVERVTWDGDIAAGWRPDPNPESPVRILPDVRFGRPSIKGVSTETIWEQDEVGLDVDEIAEVYQLDIAAHPHPRPAHPGTPPGDRGSAGPRRGWSL